MEWRSWGVRGVASAWTAALLLLGAAACDDGNPAGPEDAELSAEEASFLAAETDAAVGFVLGASVDEQGAEVAGASAPEELAYSVEPVTRTFTFERSITCPVEGSWSVSGFGTLVTDREAASVEVDASGRKEADECLRRRGGHLLGIDGVVEFVGHRKKVDGEVVELVHDIEGSWTVWLEDGDRRKTCDVDLHGELEGDVVHITGTFCGHEVDRTREL